MNTFIRWLKFNLVGAAGMVAQLAALALFNRWWAGRYLYASAAAVELTLLHNFVWHLHYTWRDRCDRSAIPGRLLRFHLSNGLVSMLGNLALMRILVLEAHMPLLVSNSIAILCCSIVNFCLGNDWVFAVRDGQTPWAPRRDPPTTDEDLSAGIPALARPACAQTVRTFFKNRFVSEHDRSTVLPLGSGSRADNTLEIDGL